MNDQSPLENSGLCNQYSVKFQLASTVKDKNVLCSTLCAARIMCTVLYATAMYYTWGTICHCVLWMTTSMVSIYWNVISSITRALKPKLSARQLVQLSRENSDSPWLGAICFCILGHSANVVVIPSIFLIYLSSKGISVLKPCVLYCSLN